MHSFKFFSRWALLACALGLAAAAGVAQAAQRLDRIVAVVEDGVILESELVARFRDFKNSQRQGGTKLPPDEVLVPQILEHMVIEKIQSQLADKVGIKVDEETLRARVQELAQRNHMSVEEFRRNLSASGESYADFLEQFRREIAISQLRAGQVNNQVKVSDREVESYLRAKGAAGGGGDRDYLLGHILVATPRAASPQDVQKAKEKAEKLVADIRKGADFKQVALGASDDEQALKGGELGWRKKGQIPSLFADLVDTMKTGDVEGPIRSSSGFHIIKMLGIRGGGEATITKTRVRHVLIKTSEEVTDEEALRKLEALRHRIENGEDFAAIARAYSDDKSSAIRGGELGWGGKEMGWVQPGVLVPEFESAMSKLAIKQLSEPVRTSFGWHLIQVLERQQSSDSDELEKSRAREEIFKRKVYEETELWLRRIRDEAYVEIRL